MKYLVNRETKEHRLMPDVYMDDAGGHIWKIAQADSEGWIPWSGGHESPIAKKMKFEAKFRNGDVEKAKGRKSYRWWHGGNQYRDIVAYRPILTKQEEPVPTPQYDPRSVSFSAFERLAAAIDASAQIPAIIDEINAQLPDGYEVVCTNSRPEVRS